MPRTALLALAFALLALSLAACLGDNSPAWSPEGPGGALLSPTPGGPRAPQLGTLGPTATETPSPTPTPLPVREWPSPDPDSPPDTPVPPPMAELQFDDDVVNVLLIGRDVETPTGNLHIYRTDVLIIASINKASATVSLLTIPRDLWVYIPGWTMQRVNTAASRGVLTDHPGGGPGLLKDTILYNFGIPIHHWAMVDFEGYRAVVDALGGVDVPVSCAIQDWRLTEPGLDDQNPENWELYTLETGLVQMDGDLALWYSRTRKRSGGDFDRSRRQHQVLRAIFDRALSLGALTRIPQLYQQYTRFVETDLTLEDALQLAPLALKISQVQIKSRFIGRSHTTGWVTPKGASVLLPDREAIAELLDEAFRPSGQSLARGRGPVEIWNGSNRADLALLAADNLQWSGIQPAIGLPDSHNYETTLLYDYTTSPKGSLRPDLQRIFRLADSDVVSAPDGSAAYPYRVVLGENYNPCLYSVPAPRATPTPGPQAGVLYTAPRLATATPIVDGDLADWPDLRYDARHFPAGAENWNGPEDLSAAWDLAWDESYLFLAVRVTDDVFVQEADAEHILLGDAVQLLFDLDPGGDAGVPELNADDRQIALSPGRLTTIPTVLPWAYRWFPEEKKAPLPEVILASRLIPGGYALEVAIPWSVIDHLPGEGQILGFALGLSDNDTAGTTRLETWAADRNTRTLDNPTTWARLQLGPPEP